MSVVTRAYELSELHEASRALQLLRSRSLVATVAILGEYFSTQKRQILVEDMHSRLEGDLEDLAERDFIGTTNPATQCTAWVNKGILARRQDRQNRQEYYELTAAGQNVLAFVSGLESPRAKAIQSRLSALTQMLAELDAQTNPDRSARLAHLYAQRDALNEHIQAVERGRVEVIPHVRALESLRDLVSLAREIPEDFYRVRDEFDAVNRQLRKDLLEGTASQAITLEEVFLGIDRVEGSEAGQSFSAFFDLLVDEKQRLLFDEAVASLDDRGLIDQLASRDADLLRTYTSSLRRSALPVRETMTTLSRNLRQFVQSRQFQQFRAMSEKLDQIQRLGLQAMEHIGHDWRVPVEYEERTFQSLSVSRLKVRVPDEERFDGVVEELPLHVLDFEQLRTNVRESEIDFEELCEAVNERLHDGPATIGQVLEEHPATQGLASIVGLVLLGMKHGIADEGHEILSWEGQFDGVQRCGTVQRIRFEEEISGLS